MSGRRLYRWLERLPVIRQLVETAETSRQTLQRLDGLYRIAAEDFVRRLVSTPRYADPRKLNRCERQIHSQSGEDGILEEIFSRIGVGVRSFVEFGAGDGTANNTIALLDRGWSGLWIEAGGEKNALLRASYAPEIAEGRLNLLPDLVTAENVEALFRRAAVPLEPDLLSIDIDSNDYWVWKAVVGFRPRVVVIEYNAIYPPKTEWVRAYDPRARWDGTSYFGASLKSLELLGASKGYGLVGCTLSGVNAFFVRQDLLGDLFCEPYTAENHYEPPRYHLVHVSGFPRRRGPSAPG